MLWPRVSLYWLSAPPPLDSGYHHNTCKSYRSWNPHIWILLCEWLQRDRGLTLEGHWWRWSWRSVDECETRCSTLDRSITALRDCTLNLLLAVFCLTGTREATGNNEEATVGDLAPLQYIRQFGVPLYIGRLGASLFGWIRPESPSFSFNDSQSFH